MADDTYYRILEGLHFLCLHSIDQTVKILILLKCTITHPHSRALVLSDLSISSKYGSSDVPFDMYLTWASYNLIAVIISISPIRS